MSWIDVWFQSWEFWAIAGLILVVADFLVGGSGNLIALGCASFLMSALAGIFTDHRHPARPKLEDCHRGVRRIFCRRYLPGAPPATPPIR